MTAITVFLRIGLRMTVMVPDISDPGPGKRRMSLCGLKDDTGDRLIGGTRGMVGEE